MPDPAEFSELDINPAHLAHEVRNLRRLVIAMLVLALVGLTLASLHSFFSIVRHEQIFQEMLGPTPLPAATQITLRIGSFPIVLYAIALLPIASMVWLWLERHRPAAPVFAMFCLCVLLMLFLIWTQMTLAFPMQQIVTSL
ncbi:MAG: hypothetical protein KDN19_07570 [Verrucomicrobiae bacterium]|nr:hypothetical protein [Verrucomicrobiae bacterium]